MTRAARAVEARGRCCWCPGGVCLWECLANAAECGLGRASLRDAGRFLRGDLTAEGCHDLGSREATLRSHGTAAGRAGAL